MVMLTINLMILLNQRKGGFRGPFPIYYRFDVMQGNMFCGGGNEQEDGWME